ncbi:MAG: bifunctional tetrahydrofolate synthase/dihydrofolate synthase [Betaproteobacteria bacterium]|nr:bifunctional tetrahydrofolate synthase/dihydrofolate synthase [Betaproteobacteria bacterium]MDE2622907.1 bifunctional tetrahydrofolate synthase/dihydrofolate synthase [Betaproteobacteria bacterium]
MPPSAGPKTLADWLAHTERLHALTIDMGLARVSRVRDIMGMQPEFPLIIVAGTNGKGSTCAVLAACLDAAGYRTGVYTSPHLVRYNERVRISGECASDRALCEAFSQVEAARGEEPLTPFEFGTLAAMQVFINEGVDVAVLEVGLGGRLDAVNIFEPACSVVTSIALDHEAWLGNTREAIGFEKAGVFRANKPAICAEPEPPESIARVAAEKGARLLQIGRDFFEERTGDRWSFTLGELSWTDLPPLKLLGEFQYRNAAAALAVLASIENLLPVTQEALRQGLRTAAVAGRFQQAALYPLVILDVAHNPHAAAELARNLRAQPCGGKTWAVFGMLHDKDIPGVIDLLDPLVDIWCVAGITDKRGASLDELRAFLSGVEGSVRGYGSLQDAFRAARADAHPEDRVVVFGSFVTVGSVMEVLEAAR